MYIELQRVLPRLVVFFYAQFTIDVRFFKKRLETMHCCCKNSVQACIILVIIGGILSILAIFVNKTAERDQPIDRTENLCIGIIYTLICGVLIFGATVRNIKVIVVWMVLACIHLLYEVHYFCSFVREKSVMDFLPTFVDCS